MYKKRSLHSLTFSVVIILLLSSVSSVALSTEQLFYDANAAYQQGDYPEAINLYEAALMKGRSSALYYNLGNAYLRNNQPGYAVLNYKRALAIDPSNADAKANFHFVRQDLQIPQYVPNTWGSYTKVFSLNTWAWLAGISVWITMGLFIIPRLYGLDRVSITALKGLMLVFTLLSVSAFFIRKPDVQQGIVLENETPLKVAPTTHSPAAGYLQAGTTIHIEKENPTHYFVQGPRHQEGWVTKEGLGKVWE